MRMPRIKQAGNGWYHVISRIVDRQMLLDDDEKRRFCTLMRATEAFSGVQLLNHTVLDNHFHLLVHVPAAKSLSDEEMLGRLNQLYTPAYVNQVRRELALYRAGGDCHAAERLRNKYICRMHDISQFAKTLKQRFTQSYNRRHKRKGTLWEERFKSVIVEGQGHPLATVSAYIDLNAVRAGIVKDPKAYRFCGYGEAIAGCSKAREGLRKVMATLGAGGKWRDVASAYRKYLYQQGEQRGKDAGGRPLRAGFCREQVQHVLDSGGELTRWELLNCRVRYFSDGAILGSRTFVNDVFDRHRQFFSLRRKDGARPLRETAWGEIYSARRLRRDVVLLPV
ncbi:MAG: transposase [Verrucomicrobia bacterium]|nr:transposase [Verrucomicrobiota bacterium]